MASNYPNSIDGESELPTEVVAPRSGTAYANSVNNLRGAIINIETELGVTPSGSEATVVARLEAIEAAGVGAHASDHTTGQTDEIDGDKLDIDYTPTNYTPSTTPAEADSVDNLTAHLYGIDQALVSVGPAPSVTLVHTDTDSGIDTSVSLTSTGVQSGDLVIIWLVTRNMGVSSPPTGGTAFTQLYLYDTAPPQADDLVGVWYKIAGGSEPGSYNATLTDTGINGFVAGVTIYRGPTTLVRNTIVPDSLITPSWPVSPGEFVVCAWCSNYLASAGQSTPTGLTDVIDEDINAAHNSDQALTVISSGIDYKGSFYRITAVDGTSETRRASVFTSWT